MIAFSKEALSLTESAPVPPVNLTSVSKTSVIVTPFVFVTTILSRTVRVDPVNNVNAASPAIFRVLLVAACNSNVLSLVPLELIVTVSAFVPALTVAPFTLFKFTVNAVDLSFVIVVVRAAIWSFKVKVSIALPLTVFVPAALASKVTDFKVSPTLVFPSASVLSIVFAFPPLTVTVVKASPVIVAVARISRVAETAFPPVTVILAPAPVAVAVTFVVPFTVAVISPAAAAVVVVIFKSVTSLKLFEFNLKNIRSYEYH